MSVYNKPDIKQKLVSKNASSYIHKKANSYNFLPNSEKIRQEDSKKYNKKKLELSPNNNESNFINLNYTTTVKELLASTNNNKKKIEINLNKNYSPNARLSKNNKNKIILLKHNKQSTSMNNINKNKNCNIIINNNINNNINNHINTNPNIKEDENKNKNMNNININIHISKKVIKQIQSKDDKAMFLNQIQIPMNSVQRNNNAKNYLKYKENITNKTSQKLSTNNLNLKHNNTENNLFNKSFNTTYKKFGKNSPRKNSVYIKRKKNGNNNFDIDVDCPEELHFFYIKIFQRGNKINFEKKDEN